MFGITLRATGKAERFWQAVDAASAFETAPSIRHLGYPPHLTLTCYDAIDPECLAAALAVFDDEREIVLTFDSIAAFDLDPLVLWLKPRPLPRLVDLHRRVHARLGEDSCDPHYRPEQWQPHCTLAVSVTEDARDAAYRFARQPIKPFSLTFDAADAVRWPPPAILSTRTLAAP